MGKTQKTKLTLTKSNKKMLLEVCKSLEKPSLLKITRKKVNKAASTKKISSKKNIEQTPVSLQKMDNFGLFKQLGMSHLEKLTRKDLDQMIIVANDAYYNNNSLLLTDNEYDIVKEYVEFLT